MAKRKTAYVCSDCGAEFPRWQGQCSECKSWNTISEFVVATAKSTARQGMSGYAGQTAAKIETLNAIDLESLPRFSSSFKELDRVLGGGIVPGAAMLIGGSPGAGKSTLLLQVMCQMAKTESALYVTGEESLQQVAMRAKRLNLPDDKLMLLAETNVETICDLALTRKPKIMVIDSIQVMHVSDVQSAPGSVSQVRERAFFFSSRRRHTRSLCNWSSDVCSSDLHRWQRGPAAWTPVAPADHRLAAAPVRHRADPVGRR